MQEEVHLGNGSIHYILLLAEDSSAAEVVVMHVADGLDKHTT